MCPANGGAFLMGGIFMSRRKVFAALFIVVGIMFFAIPIVYHYTGMRETEKLTQEFEQNLEEVQEDETEMEETGEEETEASISEKMQPYLQKGIVIAILQIEALDIRYPGGGGVFLLKPK
jgi:predicted tellurium resistance membrane protein TerC